MRCVHPGLKPNACVAGERCIQSAETERSAGPYRIERLCLPVRMVDPAARPISALRLAFRAYKMSEESLRHGTKFQRHGGVEFLDDVRFDVEVNLDILKVTVIERLRYGALRRAFPDKTCGKRVAEAAWRDIEELTGAG